MALKQEAKDKLKKLGIDVEKLESAIKDTNEVDIAVPEGTLLTESELEERDRNKFTEGKKSGEKEGETKGKEIAAKAIKKKFGIESDIKDLDKVVEEVAEKQKGGDPALKAQVEELLKDKEKLTKKMEEERQKAEQLALDTQLIGLFPANRGTDLTDTERLAIIKANLQIEKTESGLVVKRNGQIIQDEKTKAALPLDKVIPDYFNERKWISGAPGSGTGGRGGGDNPPAGGGGTPRSFSEAQKEWDRLNPNKGIVGPEFQAYLATVSKTEGFDMNK